MLAHGGAAVLSSVLPRLYLLRFRIHWIFFRSDGSEAMGAVVGHGGVKARSSASKSEVKDNRYDGVPPELALLLVKTGFDVAFLHFGKRRRRVNGGLPCLLRTQTIAGGHESHRDGAGVGPAPFSCGLDITPPPPHSNRACA